MNPVRNGIFNTGRKINPRNVAIRVDHAFLFGWLFQF